MINQQCFTRVFSPQLIRNVRSRRRMDSASIIAHPVNLRWERLLKCYANNSTYTDIYVYDALDNRYGFSISVQPEIAPLFTVSFNEIKKKKKIFKNWQVCDWLAKWIIMLRFMDLRWPRVFRCSSVGLVTPQPSGLEGYCHGRGGQPELTARLAELTHISVAGWRIFSIRSSVEFSRPLVVHRHGHLPICPIWACPWAKNLSNLPQIGSRLCGSHISETAGWMYPI